MAEEGYGSGLWGTSQWGVGTIPPTPPAPIIIPLDPLEEATGVAQLQPINFRLTDEVGISLATLKVSVGVDNWVIGGVPQNGVEMTAVLNDLNGYDIELKPPAPYQIGSRLAVSVFVKDVEDVGASKTYHFNVGVGVRMIQVKNSIDGLLVVHFNKAMLLNGEFFSIGNWIISPVSEGAADLSVIEIVASQSEPHVAYLRHTGGGSTYTLTAVGILGADGSPIEDGFESVEFEIDFDEEEAPSVRLFDSVFGPLGISRRSRLRRTMDEFSANRSISLALDEQFRLRFQQLDNTVGRDGKDGKLRT